MALFSYFHLCSSAVHTGIHGFLHISDGYSAIPTPFIENWSFSLIGKAAFISLFMRVL